MSDSEKGFQIEDRDFYISPTYGEPRKLRIQQASKGIVHQKHRSILRHINNVSPIWARIGTWPKRMPGRRWSILIVPWIFCVLVSYTILAFSISKSYFFPSSDSKAASTGSTNYDEFDYSFNGYAVTASNAHEDLQQAGKAAIVNNPDLRTHHLRPHSPFPRRLARVVKEGTPSEYVDTDKLSGKLDAKNPTGFPQYLFISYTVDQFRTAEEKLVRQSLAQKATIQLGLEYYWDTSCLYSYSENDKDNDCYNISDYVRNADCVLVLVGSTGEEGGLSSDPVEKQAQIDNLLRRWGQRAWTFPEAILAKELMLCVRNVTTFIKLRRKDLLKSAWEDDSGAVTRLIDHHEGTTALGRLEHVITALTAIQTRTVGDQRFPGDRTYVLMGFMSQRPDVNPQDSDFEAFARLSLANDSDKLLERLICIAPLEPNQPWHDLRDSWNSNLWNIQPSCEVCGIAEDDTVLLSGIQVGGVRWKGFKKVPVSLPTIDNCILLAVYATLSLLSIVYYPWFVEKLLNGSLWGVEEVFDDTARLMGFEGYMSLEEIERHVWGSYDERLSWSPFGSPLSVDEASAETQATGVKALGRRMRRKARGKSNQAVPYAMRCSGKDPWEQNGQLILDMAERTDQKVFTLVDTYNEEVIMFLAKRPPVAFIACGQEGGMLRAVGVSYVHETETLYRECVVRLQTPALDCMHRLGRVRFGFRRPDKVMECLNDSPW